MEYHSVNPMTIIPKDLKPGDILAFRVVAVIGNNKDWAAYRGYSEWTDEEIACSGDKISKKAAEQLFYAPGQAKLTYRE
jgi:hypothetical protein